MVRTPDATLLKRNHPHPSPSRPFAQALIKGNELWKRILPGARFLYGMLPPKLKETAIEARKIFKLEFEGPYRKARAAQVLAICYKGDRVRRTHWQNMAKMLLTAVTEKECTELLQDYDPKHKVQATLDRSRQKNQPKTTPNKSAVADTVHSEIRTVKRPRKPRSPKLNLSILLGLLENIKSDFSDLVVQSTYQELRKYTFTPSLIKQAHELLGSRKINGQKLEKSDTAQNAFALFRLMEISKNRLNTIEMAAAALKREEYLPAAQKEYINGRFFTAKSDPAETLGVKMNSLSELHAKTHSEKTRARIECFAALICIQEKDQGAALWAARALSRKPGLLLEDEITLLKYYFCPTLEQIRQRKAEELPELAKNVTATYNKAKEYRMNKQVRIDCGEALSVIHDLITPNSPTAFNYSDIRRRLEQTQNAVPPTLEGIRKQLLFRDSPKSKPAPAPFPPAESLPLPPPMVIKRTKLRPIGRNISQKRAKEEEEESKTVKHKTKPTTPTVALWIPPSEGHAEDGIRKETPSDTSSPGKKLQDLPSLSPSSGPIDYSIILRNHFGKKGKKGPSQKGPSKGKPSTSTALWTPPENNHADESSPGKAELKARGFARTTEDEGVDDVWAEVRRKNAAAREAAKKEEIPGFDLI